MGRVTPEQIQLWTSVIAAALPAGTAAVRLTIEGVAGVVRAIRRMRGEPDSAQAEAEDVLVATEVIGALERAGHPWARVRDRADRELGRL